MAGPPSSRPSPRWVSSVPNLLSSCRLALAAAFPFIAPGWQLPVVIAGGLSDWLDGFIARRFGATSIGGGILDAIADKLFVLSVLITLTVEGRIAFWQVILVLMRDLAVLGAAAYTAAVRNWPAFKRMVARMPGKVATVLFFVWAATMFAAAAAPARTPLFWVTAGCSLFAAADYLRRFFLALREPAG